METHTPENIENLKAACDYLRNCTLFMTGRMCGEANRVGAHGLDFYKWRKVSRQVVANADLIAQGQKPADIDWEPTIDDILGRT